MELPKINLMYKIPGIIILSICLLYIVRLKYCKCSDKKERDYLKYLIILLIMFSLLTSIPNFPRKFILIFQAILQFMFLILSIKYIKYLKKIECECSEDWKREFMYIYSWISIIIIVISLIIMPLSIVYIARNFDSFKKQTELLKKNSKKIVE